MKASAQAPAKKSRKRDFKEYKREGHPRLRQGGHGQILRQTLLTYGRARGDSCAHTSALHAASALWTQSPGQTDAVTRKGGKRELKQAKPGNPSPPDGSRRLHLDPHVRPRACRGAGDGERAATPGCASGLTSRTPSPRLPVVGQRGDVTTACPTTCQRSCSPCSGAPAERAG